MVLKARGVWRGIRELNIITSAYRIRKFLILYINEGSVHALKARSKLIPINQHAALVAVGAQTAGDHLHRGSPSKERPARIRDRLGQAPAGAGTGSATCSRP